MSVMQQLSDAGSTVYSIREMHGVVILVVVSCISLVAVVGLLVAIALSALNTRSSLDQHLFVRTHVAAYFVSLLLCNFLQAIGSIVNAAWINHMGVRAGNLCAFQGVLKQASDIGTAIWTLIIAIHTFCLLFLEQRMRPFVLWTTLFFGWSAIACLVMIGPAALETDKRGPFFGISGYWCWISPQYKVERITLDYMIVFLAAFASFVLYLLVFLQLRGKVVQNGWRIRFLKNSETDPTEWRGRKIPDDQAMSIARHMLLYPIAYIIFVLPISASRFASWAGQNVPFEIMIFSAAVFLLSGLMNVVLFTTTRRILPAKSLWISHRTTPQLGGSASIQDQRRGHSRTESQSSSDSTIVAGSVDYPASNQSRRTKPRPPDIIIHRDSLDSVYSVYDEEEQHSAFPAHRSPDGSHQHR
ncbi:hypothetical protein Hypma_008005 [Hypsizygus marmoreus]|uniref:Uncharacterized protein n=1 Tax=Hypsizygus marmoreus TaxID=39966 RepID=A0A369JRA7_HYPMA|nr:hypothetical protein Hypma_008005 [Hypsizygus marmoreus]